MVFRSCFQSSFHWTFQWSFQSSFCIMDSKLSATPIIPRRWSTIYIVGYLRPPLRTHRFSAYSPIELIGRWALVLGGQLSEHFLDVIPHNKSVDRVVLEQPICLLSDVAWVSKLKFGAASPRITMLQLLWRLSPVPHNCTSCSSPDKSIWGR